MSVVINEFEVVPAAQQPQQGQQAAAAPPAPPGAGEIDEELRRALKRMQARKQRLKAT